MNEGDGCALVVVVVLAVFGAAGWAMERGAASRDAEVCGLRADTTATADTMAIVRAHPECRDILLDVPGP